MQGDDSSHIITTIQDDDQEIEYEPTQSQEVMRSKKSKTQSIRLNAYEMFPDQAIWENGDLVEEAMMVESEPLDHVQAIKYENWKYAMNEELKAIEKEKN